MVILIAGVGYAGKTLMAQKLLEKYKYPYLSMDHIKMGLYRSNIDYGFTPESDDDIIIGKLWPIIKGIIMTNIENGQNIIIEGCYFPNSINELPKEYLNKIIFFSMLFTEKYCRKYFMDKIIKNRDAIEKRGYEFENSNNFLEKYILENKTKKKICKINGIKYFEIDENYDNEINTIYKWIEEKIIEIDNGVRPYFV